MREYDSHRNSKQRQVILDELRRLKSHPTAVGLYEAVRRRIPNISLGTVYRNLELLTRLGLIQKLECGGRQARFDGNAGNHFHIECVQCGKVDDIHALSLDLSSKKGNDFNGFQVLDADVRLRGVCPRCRKIMAIKKRKTT